VIWDRTTRLIHWVIALAVILNLWVLEEGDDPHQISGYVAFAATSLRIFWGFWGGPQSRFSAFPVSFRQLRSVIQTRGTQSPDQYPGHNPLASLVYLGMWLAICCLAMTGWMMGLDAFWGDEGLENIHGAIANALQILVVLHLLGIIMDSVKFRRKTWLSMFTGRRAPKI
jgi:cytochrome b